MSTEKEKVIQGLLYDANNDKQLLKERETCKDLCFQYNQITPSDVIEQVRIQNRLFKQIGSECTIVAPFYCDYGYNISIGNHFFMNHNGVILDGVSVSIGNYVFIGPNCCMSTATHPVQVKLRNQGLEYAYPIIIEDNVWIGANVTILPGVTIGNNTVIGAGSVVTKSIPSNVVAFGNPCIVKREINEENI